MYSVVSFSGGKDSTAMLIKMLDQKINIDEIVHIDTTKEFPEMYNHIDMVKDYIKPLTITTIKMDFDYWFGEHVKTKGNNIGQVGYGWPDSRTRWCTGLKKQLFKKHLFNKKPIKAYIGLTHEEQWRIDRGDKAKKYTYVYPLSEWGMTQKDTLQLCYDRGFKWNGLYENIERVSCYLCPLQKIHELKYIYNYYPDLWDEMEFMDKKSSRQFRAEYKLVELSNRFEKENYLSDNRKRK